jgi:hypothetical protein
VTVDHFQVRNVVDGRLNPFLQQCECLAEAREVAQRIAVMRNPSPVIVELDFRQHPEDYVNEGGGNAVIIECARVENMTKRVWL